MEKYFEVKKDSDFYKKYFDFVNMSDKVNELFKKFAKDNGIETKKYCQNTERLVIVPTQEDRIKFKGMFVQNSDTDFKKTAPICKSWTNMVTMCTGKFSMQKTMVFHRIESVYI